MFEGMLLDKGSVLEKINLFGYYWFQGVLKALTDQ